MDKIKEDINVGENPDIINPQKRGRIEQGGLGYEPLMPNPETTHEIAGEAYSKIMDKMRRYLPDGQLPQSNNEAARLVMSAMGLLDRIKPLENRHIEYLEMIALETVLGLPEFQSAKEAYQNGDIQIDIELVTGHVISNDEAIEQELGNVPDEAVNDISQDILRALTNMDQEKMKRRFANVMLQGASHNYIFLFELLREELANIDPELLDMYGFFMAVSNAMYWVFPEMNMEGSPQGGEESVSQDEETGAGIIKARAALFPLLIHELVKGLMEYTNTMGLPRNKGIAQDVMADVDKAENEVYDLMLGPAFWKRLRDAVGDDVELLFHVWNKIISLPASDPTLKDSFAGFIQKFLQSPEDAKRIIRPFITDIKNAIKRYENDVENGMPTFESFQYTTISEALTKAMRALLLKFPDLREEELEKWAAVDPTGEKGLNLPMILNLKQEKKIRSPRDIMRIIDKTTYVPTKLKKDKVNKRTVEIKPSPEERIKFIHKNVNNSLPWILKQLKLGNIRFPEDLEDVHDALHLFFQYRNKKYWNEENSKDLFTYKSFSDLADVTGELQRKLFAAEYSDNIEIKPDTELIAVDGPYAIVRIKPTPRGQQSLHEYAYLSRDEKYAYWCVANKGKSGWDYFTQYLKFSQEPALEDAKKNHTAPPQQYIDDPFYSYYYIAKNGMPYILFEFKSNFYMNKGDSEARTDPEYASKIRTFIWKHLKFARDIIEPSISARSPSKKLVDFANNHPDEVVSLIMQKLLYMEKEYGRPIVSSVRGDEQGAKTLAQHILSQLTNDVNNLFRVKDNVWRQSMGTWAKHSSGGNISLGVNPNTGQVAQRTINFNTPEFINLFVNAIMSGSEPPRNHSVDFSKKISEIMFQRTEIAEVKECMAKTVNPAIMESLTW